MPVLVAAAHEPEHKPLAEAPEFESFVAEGWQKWLGASY
jgi:hypothetical protein